jgi:hypothetical protein
MVNQLQTPKNWLTKNNHASDYTINRFDLPCDSIQLLWINQQLFPASMN